MLSNSADAPFLKFWLPVYLYAGLIFWYSSLSVPPFAPRILYADKLLHFLEYAVFGYLLARAARHSAAMQLKAHFRFFAVVMAVSYGISDEFHQYFVPGRTVECYDVLADSLGAFVGQLLLRK